MNPGVKTLLLPILAGCGAILSFSSLQAEESATRNYGGLAPGKQFTLKVTERRSVQTKWAHATRNVPVPDGIPDLRKGRNVEFTIGRFGQLKGPGFSIAFRSRSFSSNVYSNNHDGDSSEGEAAVVRKKPWNKPTWVSLTFYEFKFSGFVPTTNTVTYVME